MAKSKGTAVSAPPHSTVTAATPTASVGGSSTMEAPSAELLEVIRKYSPAFKDMAKDLVDVTALAPEPVYIPPAVVVPEGFRMLGDLIPLCAGNTTPVRVFDDSDWPDEIRSYIPAELPNGGKWHWQKDLVEDLAFALYSGDRTLLHGPTGTGKSAMVEAWCHLTRTPLIRVNCHREMQSTDFLGKDIIKSTPQGPVLEYDWSLTTIAVKNGGMLLIDEAFRSPHLMAIQSLLERNGTLTLPDAASLSPEQRRLVPPKDRFWVVLTDNSVGTGDETGAYVTEVQDISTLDRITAAIYVDHPSAKVEAKELKEDFPEVTTAKLEMLTEWAAIIRSAFKSGNMQQTVSRRALGAILRKFMVTGNLNGAARLSFISKLGAADKHKAKEAWMQVFAEELEPANSPGKK